jgi:glycogen debranching enzyme
MLFYIKPFDVPEEKLYKIARASEILKTPFGYRTYSPKKKGYAPGAYHHGSIWPWYQAYIALGAIKHNRKEIAKSAMGTINALAKFDYHFTELFSYDKKKLRRLGCHIQLWTIACVKAMYDISKL